MVFLNVIGNGNVFLEAHITKQTSRGFCGVRKTSLSQRMPCLLLVFMYSSRAHKVEGINRYVKKIAATLI